MIFNLNSLRYVARRPLWALNWRDRLRGMIGRRFAAKDGIDAMVFPRCRSVHTLCLWMPVDVIFLDTDFRVVKLLCGAKPWRWSLFCREAVAVIQLPAGMIVESGTELGHCLNLNSTLSTETIEKLRKTAVLGVRAVPRTETGDAG